MSVCIHLIAKHNFYDIANKENFAAFINDTIERIKVSFHIVDEDEIEICDMGDGYISIYTPYGDAIFHQGAWEIALPYDFVHLVLHDGDWFWMQDLAFDWALCFGASELWYCLETDCQFIEMFPYEKIMTFLHKRRGTPTEFSIEDVLKREATTDYNIGKLKYDPFYHDSLLLQFERFDQLSNKAKQKDVKLLGLSRFGRDYLLVKQGTGVNLMHINTGNLLFDNPKEQIIDENGSEFTTMDGGVHIKYKNDGIQITEIK